MRPAIAAGAFYPADPDSLRETLNRLLGAVDVTPQPAIGVVVPHAGYAFSGSCAAAAFAAITIPSSVVLVGPDHFGAGLEAVGASVYAGGAFATPLGEVEIDAGFVAELLETTQLVRPDPEAHREEHALEVELPFLLMRAGPRPPRIVPILLRWHDWARCEKLATTLAAILRRRGPGQVLLLASSDLTHFEPAVEAYRLDEWALAAMRRLDGEELLRVCAQHNLTMCGRAPTAVVLEAARQLGAHRADVRAHTHSGTATGDFSSVVSYAGVVIR